MELKNIVDALPKKGVSKIAKKTGLSHTMVSLVLNGKRENDTVIDAALDLIEEERKIRAERENRLKKILHK